MSIKQFKKVAIANRGEVAVRIIHACQELQIKTVLLHSEADINTIAYRLADEKICIGPAATVESYLNISRNIDGALAARADAVHPGFGFLSENAEFAKAVVDAGMTFIGPTTESIRLMGDKISAKKIMTEAKVPVIPGYQGEDQSSARFILEAEKIGFPVLIKAAAGGGGRGMKVVHSSNEMKEQLESAQREAKSAFGSPIVFMEKYIAAPKHIEFQVFGDTYGNVVHLYDRECSVQRRHQKIIEEATSCSLTEATRMKMAHAAVEAAKRVKYVGAGTVEFLLDGDQFYFLEMNTRLQVEHPVTELVLGVDLVKTQILVAQGGVMPFMQNELKPRGHAIECRLYAEDAYNRGMPSTGILGGLHWPQGPGRRFEVGFESGDEVTSFYDPMIAKIIVWDETRLRAIQKMLRVLEETVIFGVKTNIPYLQAILSHSEFIQGTMTTKFIEKYFPEGLSARELSDSEKWMAEKLYQQVSASNLSDSSLLGDDGAANPFLQAWRFV